MSILVVVADSARAKLLRAEDRRSPLTEIKDLIFPDARLREQDLVSDGSGAGNGNGTGSHSMGHEKDAIKHQIEVFARDLCQDLERFCRDDGVHKIYLIAAPKFLGLLRSNLSKPCADRVCGELDKDLVNHSIQDIRSYLPKIL